MASTPFPTDSGEDDQAPDLSGVSRLSDAERIAAERLNGSDAGHQAASGQSGPAISDPAYAPDASAAAVESLTPPPFAPIEPGSLQTEALPPPIGSLTDAVAELTATAEPPKVEQVGASAAATPDRQAPPIAVVAPATGTPPAAREQPLIGALDAAAKLAADANVAAEALENLRRMLQQQATVASGSVSATQGAPVPAWPTAPVAVGKPPPLPQDGGTVGHHRSQLAIAPAPRAASERSRLDVRGFLAGVALSCAVGVVLYLFMTAG